MVTRYSPVPLHEISVERIKASIRDVPDFPKPGILFKDITTVLRDRQLLRHTVDYLYHQVKDQQLDYIVAIESRGFILGSALSCALGVGFVPVRKAGKLPAAVVRHSYALEYGQDCVEIHQDAIEPGARVAVVDDLLATGGTAAAAAHLLQKIGVQVHSLLFMIELEELSGRARLPAGAEVHVAIRC
ncbi:MAG: adenine phosphoribosyltransferase [Kofleriaceae bacterium]